MLATTPTTSDVMIVIITITSFQIRLMQKLEVVALAELYQNVHGVGNKGQQKSSAAFRDGG